MESKADDERERESERARVRLKERERESSTRQRLGQTMPDCGLNHLILTKPLSMT